MLPLFGATAAPSIADVLYECPLPHPPLIAIPFLPLLLPIHRSTQFSFRRLLRLLQGRKWFSGRIRKASFTVHDAAHAAWLR